MQTIYHSAVVWIIALNTYATGSCKVLYFLENFIAVILIIVMPAT